ncbi:MAG: hypothetical protein IJX18_01435, partial [Clostridia bacterium]|nr:hypothetical protein [Clostridia bacterium]
MWTKEEKSYIWLDSFLLDATEKNALVKEADGAVGVVRQFARFRERFFQKGRGELYEKMADSLRDDAYFKNLQSFYEEQKITPVTRATEGYFEEWKDFPDSPCVLYVKGDVGLLRT